MKQLSNRSRKRIASLTKKRFREKYGQYFVEGWRGVQTAILAGAPISEIVVSQRGRDDDRVRQLVAEVDISVYECPDTVMDELSDVKTHQGILAVVERDLGGQEDLAPFDTILALDQVQDPGNAGTIMRTAVWFGVQGVIAGKGTVDLTNPKVVRSGMGAHWDLTIVEIDDLASVLNEFGGAGFTSYGADVEGYPVREWDPEAPSLLVFGNEAHGISEEVEMAVDKTICIPEAKGRVSAPAGVESLNVSVASGIILYEWLG